VHAPESTPPPLRRQPEFRKLWAGQTISVFGDQVTLLAIPLAAAITVKASPLEMGVLTAAAWFPHLLFSLHAGAWIDRHGRRRRRMIASDLGRAAVLTTVPLAYAFGEVTIAHLYAVAFAVGSLAVLFDLSWSTLFVTVVPRRDFIEANARLFQSRALASVAGPTLAGALVQLLKAPMAILIDALSYLGSALFLSRIQAIEPQPEPDAETPLRSQVMAGARFIFSNRTYRASLLAFSTANFFNLMFTSLFILYVTRELNIRPGVLGIVLGAGAVGGLLGAAGAPRLARGIGVGRSMILGSLVSSVSLLLIPAAAGATWRVVVMLFIAQFFGALGVMILDVNGNSLNAALAPERLRARITGAHRVINYGVRPLGALLGGVLGASIGLRPTLWLAVGGAITAVLWLLPSPIRTLRALPEAAA
jgi:MFS family permease